MSWLTYNQRHKVTRHFCVYVRNHARATANTARAATSRERAFLANDAEPVATGKRSRAKPSFFEAGATRLHGSRKLENQPAPPRAASCPPVPRNRTGNAERARGRKASREAYAKAIEELADNTFFDLSWEQRRIVAVCWYARALSCGCAKMSAARGYWLAWPQEFTRGQFVASSRGGWPMRVSSIR